MTQGRAAIRRLAIPAAAAVILPSAALARASASIGPPPAAAARGIDVPSFQHPGGVRIVWSSVARAGYRFAFIKATEGSYYVNPYLRADVAAAELRGPLAAAYHFANPADSSGTLSGKPGRTSVSVTVSAAGAASVTWRFTWTVT